VFSLWVQFPNNAIFIIGSMPRYDPWWWPCWKSEHQNHITVSQSSNDYFLQFWLLLCLFFPSIVQNNAIVTLEPFNRTGSGRFGAVTFYSTHHFIGNACTKSGPLLFPSFPVVNWFCLFVVFGRLLGVR
jgi:hypothetical protein